MPVRPAVGADFQAICRLYAELQPKRPPPTDGRGERLWQDLLAHAGTTVFVLDEGNGPVAAVTLHVLPNLTYGGAPYALIENVITAAERRGKGLGHEIMAHALEQARSAGCYKAMLLTGLTRGAAGFSEKLGFTGNEKSGMIMRFGENQ